MRILQPTISVRQDNRKVVEASEHGPCAQCPWRLDNQGKRHPDGWYSIKNLRRLWAGLRSGERMTCHPTDPCNPVPVGHRAAPESATTRECAGAQILIQRELDRVQDVLRAKGEFSEYKAANPRGLTKVGAYTHAMSMAVRLPGELKYAPVDLNDESVGHRDLTPWEVK